MYACLLTTMASAQDAISVAGSDENMSAALSRPRNGRWVPLLPWFKRLPAAESPNYLILNSAAVSQGYLRTG